LLKPKKTKPEGFKSIESKHDFYSGIAQKIWGFAEVGFQETQSSALLQQTLKDAWFQIEAGCCGHANSIRGNLWIR